MCNVRWWITRSLLGGFGGARISVTSWWVWGEDYSHFLAGLGGGLCLPMACCLAACTLALLCCLSAFCYKDTNNMDINFKHSFKMNQNFFIWLCHRYKSTYTDPLLISPLKIVHISFPGSPHGRHSLC